MITILSVLGAGAALILAVLVYVERRSKHQEWSNKIKDEDDDYPLTRYTQVGIVGSDQVIGELIDDVATIINCKPYRVVRIDQEDVLKLHPYGTKRIIAEELLVRIPMYDRVL